MAQLTGDSLATMIYTSGTTGRPKGVELPHSNWVFMGASIEALDILHEPDLHFLWLPLSHVFGKVLLAGQYQIGWTTATDGRVPKISENLLKVHPTAMAGVPRIFEKIYQGANSRTEAAGGAKLKIFKWAFNTSMDVKAKQRAGQSAGPFAGIQMAHRRQAGVLQDPRGDRRQHQGPGLRVRGAQRRGRPLVRRGRAADPRGLRPDGEHRGRLHHPSRRHRLRHHRTAVPGHRGQDRRRRRGAPARSAHHARLPQPARGERRDAAGRRLAGHRGHRRARRSRPVEDHRPQEGPGQDLGRQVHRSRARSPRSSRRCRRSPRTSSRSRTTATSRRR